MVQICYKLCRLRKYHCIFGIFSFQLIKTAKSDIAQSQDALVTEAMMKDTTTPRLTAWKPLLLSHHSIVPWLPASRPISGHIPSFDRCECPLRYLFHILSDLYAFALTD